MRAHHATQLSLALAVGCSSPAPSSGLEAPTVASLACAPKDSNPYGACYPTGEGVVPNYCFDSFCLAQLYDPASKLPARLLHITVVASWCGAASGETDFITGSNTSGQNPSGVSWSKELAPEVVFVQLLSDGPTLGTGATINDLNQWLETLGVFFDAAAIPLNIDIDTRTMRILDSSVGFDSQLDQALAKLVASLG